MSPNLTTEERLQAVRYLVPLLGQDIDSWSAKAIPRAMAALAADARFQPGVGGREGDPAGDRDGRRGQERPEQRVSSGFDAGRRNARQDRAIERPRQPSAKRSRRSLRNRNEPFQRAALARAALPLLETGDGDSATVLLCHRSGRNARPGGNAGRTRSCAQRRYGRCRRRAATSPGGTGRCGQTEAVRRSAAAPAPRLERGAPANANRTRTAPPHRRVSWRSWHRH